MTTTMAMRTLDGSVEPDDGASVCSVITGNSKHVLYNRKGVKGPLFVEDQSSEFLQFKISARAHEQSRQLPE